VSELSATTSACPFPRLAARAALFRHESDANRLLGKPSSGAPQPHAHNRGTSHPRIHDPDTRFGVSGRTRLGTSSKRFDRLVKAAGVPRIRLHDCRHTCATTLLEQGVPLKVVTERLGHSSTRITADLYQHASETMQDDAAAKLGAALLGETNDHSQ
jgi:integrase